MELRQLEYFIAVAEEANFTRAAERVRISQSGVSAQLKQLELDLGAPLIDRSGRTATVTAAGAAALGPARAALASVQAVRKAVDEVTGLVRGRLTVGMVTACTVTPLFDALAAFHHTHPGIEISLFEDNSDRLLDAVLTGAADLALIAASDSGLEEYAGPGGLGAARIVRERIVAAVPPGHPLTAPDRVTLADVAAHPIVSLPPGAGIRAVFEEACVACDLQPEIAFQASAPAAVADLAARGLGVAVLSETTAAPHAERLTALVIDDVEIRAVLALVWSRSVNPALRELLVHCREQFGLSSEQ
ncbi:MAG TPA: LysR family transcriptional regulator [Actinocrinis sp.]|nr:LysR family transcriptional regulator [Actinocrinis sp.]